MVAHRNLRRSAWTQTVIYSAFFILSTQSLVAHAVTAPVGATAGSFSVNNNGGANYDIPIVTPPGTAGMAPHLALKYERQIENALLGIGWSVSGLSVIQRCGRTLVLDGQKGGVNYDTNDRFCLDGQRLVAINNGTDGADGTEYRTQQESFIKVVSYGPSNCALDPAGAPSVGPTCFKVYLRNGSVMEYGNTADARIQAQGKSVVRLWALNKSLDTKGNYFTVAYFEDNANGEYRPTRIDYTGNANAGLVPYNSVQFVYAARPDIVSLSQGPALIKVTQRLTNVQTYTGITLVRDYRLAYDNSGAVGQSRLTSVTECGSDGVCLPPTTLGWQTPSIGLQNQIWSGGTGVGTSGNWQIVDLFGDGRPVYWSNSNDGTHYATRLNPDGTLQNWIWPNGVGVGTSGHWQIVDLFGDGRPVYWSNSNDGTHYATRLNPDGTLQNWIWPGGIGVGTSGHWQIVDLFGDGRSVYWSNSNDGTHYATRLNPDGTLQNWTWSGGIGVGTSGNWQIVDLFGDGRPVYWSNSNDGTHYTTRFSSSKPDFFTSITNGLNAQTTINYKPLTDNTVYTKDHNAVYPYQDVQNSTYVVSNYTTSDGIGGTRAYSYTYKGAKTHLTGGGWLGYREIQVINQAEGLRTTTDYQNQAYNGTQTLETYTETARISDNRILKSLQHFWSAAACGYGPCTVAHLDGTVNRASELDGSPITYVGTNYTYDAFGNALTVSANSNDGYTKLTTNTYAPPNTAQWILGLVTGTQVDSTIPGPVKK